jgi:hypothetical protein
MARAASSRQRSEGGVIRLGKKAKKKAKKAAEKAKRTIHEATRPDDEVTRPADYGMAPPPAATPRDAAPPVALPPSAMASPDYPEDAREVQRTPRPERKKRSAVKKKTIKAMHLEVNRRIAAVGAEQTVLDPDMTDHEKYVQLGRQVGNIGDTLAGGRADAELVRHELIRVMALAGAWAQSISEKR